MYSVCDDFSRKAPDGYTALASSGDGNCMYNSVCILLFGSERYAAHLRLLCAIHAVDHFDHYLTTVNLPLHLAFSNHKFILSS